MLSGIFVIMFLLAIGIANFARQRFDDAMKSDGKPVLPTKTTAGAIAREFLDENEATEVKIVEHNGLVTDYFDAKRRVLFLHRDTMNGTGAAAWALALHEAAHATQIGPMLAAVQMRASNIKLTRYVPALSGIAFLLLGFLKRVPFPIGWRIVAVIWFVVMALNAFSLPVEFNASQRALAFLASRLRKDPEDLEELAHALKGVAWRDTAAFLRSPVYCLFGALPVGGAMRPR